MVNKQGDNNLQNGDKYSDDQNNRNYFNGTALANSDQCPALVRPEARAALRRLGLALFQRLT